MIKFLFYLFLFYFIFRYLFGGFKVKVFHYHQNQPTPQGNPEPREEGRITIDPKVPQKKKGSDNKLGEYVDFEEVK